MMDELPMVAEDVAMKVSVENPQRFLDDYTQLPNELSISQLDTDFLEQQLENDLKSSKEHFSKLKLEYLKLETKQGLLEHLASQGQESSKMGKISESDIDELSALVDEGKKKIVAAKSETKAVKKLIRQVIPELCAKWQAVQESQTKISNLYTKENYENEAAQMNIRLNVAEQSLGFGGASKEDLSVSTVEQGERIQTKQESSLQALNQRAEVAAQELSTIEASMKPMETRLEGLRKDMEKMREKQAQALHKSRQVISKQQARLESQIKTMSVLGKVAVTRNASTGSLVVGLKDDENSGFTLTINFRGDSEVVESFQLTSQSEEAAPDVSDIVEAAQGTKKLGFIVREVQARLLFM